MSISLMWFTIIWFGFWGYIFLKLCNNFSNMDVDEPFDFALTKTPPQMLQRCPSPPAANKKDVPQKPKYGGEVELW